MKKLWVVLLSILLGLILLIVFLGFISGSQMTATVKHNFPIYGEEEVPRAAIVKHNFPIYENETEEIPEEPEPPMAIVKHNFPQVSSNETAQLQNVTVDLGERFSLINFFKGLFK